MAVFLWLNGGNQQDKAIQYYMTGNSSKQGKR